MVISVVIRTVGFGMVTRGQGRHLVSIYRVGPEEVLDFLCHLLNRKSNKDIIIDTRSPDKSAYLKFLFNFSTKTFD